MNRTQLLSALICLLATSGSAAAWAADPIVDDITRANATVQQATQTYDGATIDRMLTGDFILVNSRGSIYNRAAFLADIVDKSSVWEFNRTESLSIQHYNADCAIAIGTLHLRYRTGGRVTDRRIRFTDIWVKQQGAWKWATSAVSPVGAPPAVTSDARGLEPRSIRFS